jgi:hypothetical protein
VRTENKVRYRADDYVSSSYRRALSVESTKSESAMPLKPPVKPHSSNVLDYPCTMSGFEKDSLVAEAKLKAEREKPSPKSARTRNVSK